MAIRDEDFSADLALVEGDDGNWSPPAATPASAPRNWKSLYERELKRAKAAEARVQELLDDVRRLRRALGRPEAGTGRPKSPPPAGQAGAGGPKSASPARRERQHVPAPAKSQQAIKSLRAERGELRKEVTGLRREVSRLNKKLDQERQRTEDLKATGRKLSGEVIELHAELRHRRDQMDRVLSLSDEVFWLRFSVKGADAREETLKARVARVLRISKAHREALSAADAGLRKALRRSRRQKATIRSLTRKNVRLRKAAKTSQARIAALEARVSKLRATGAALSRTLFGRKSEKQKKPSTGRTRGQQRGAPGHGRTQRPGLEERKEEKTPPEDALICSCCGKPYAPNGTEESAIFEIEVKAHKRRIVRPRWRRACECASSPREVIAPPVPRLFDRTPYGISVWSQYLYERYACFRPLKRVAAWMSDMGLSISPGTLGSSVKPFVPLFKPVAEAILDHQNKAAVRHGDETGWRIRSLRETGGSARSWLWTSVTEDSAFFHSDPSRSAEVAMKLFGSTKGTVVLVCDRLSTYKKLARDLAGKIILQWCWAHQRRTFIDCAAGQVRLTEWCQGWIERIAGIYRLNDERLKHYDPALERQTPEFDAAQGALKEGLDALFSEAERQLSDLPAKAREGKALRSLLNHREGLCVFVDHPLVPMDNNFAERVLRGPVIGRRLSFGSDSKLGAEFTAMMYTVVCTLKMNDIDILRWLRAWLEACAENGGQPPEDLKPWLPWSMSEKRRREFLVQG